MDNVSATMIFNYIFRGLTHARSGYVMIMWSFLLIMTSRSRDLESYETNDIERKIDIRSQVAIDPYTNHKLPVLRLLKRQVKLKNFRNGRKWSLTLVFHSNQPVDVHWFKIETVDNDEMMYPILDGHPYYELNEVYSGDVTATTLVIPRAYHEQDHVFETILTSYNDTMQYTIKTNLDSNKRHQYFLDNIDSPEWLVVPPTEIHLDEDDHFERHCRTFVHQKNGGNDLLLMNAQPITSKHGGKSRPEFMTMVHTHDSGQEYHVEEVGSMILKGTVTMLPKYRRHAVFDVKAEQPEADRVREGVYLCVMERYVDSSTLLDRSYLLSYVTVGKQHTLGNLLPIKPIVEIVTCDTNNNQIKDKTVYLTEGVLGCIRCRGFGYPKPEVEIRRKYDNGDIELTSVNPTKISVTKYVNVVEAGIVEAIYVFQSPEKSMEGSHICKALNSNGGKSIFFEIKFRHKNRHRTNN